MSTPAMTIERVEAVADPRIVVVTRMQRQVIGELARDGAGNQQIADRLGISYDTCRVHMKAALARVGAPNRTALVCLLLRGQVKLRVEDNRGGYREPVESAA